MKYYGILPKRKLWVKIAAIILGVLATYLAYAKGDYLYVPFSLVLIPISFSKRRQVVSKEGIDIEYHLLGHTFHNLWSYDEILAIHKDSLTSAPNIQLHFSKGVINRRFIFSKEDTTSIIGYIHQIKPKMKILEVNH